MDESMAEMRVDRCACINKSFAELSGYNSLGECMAATRAGSECGGCVPYLKLLFETGETSFAIDDPRLPPDAFI